MDSRRAACGFSSWTGAGDRCGWLAGLAGAGALAGFFVPAVRLAFGWLFFIPAARFFAAFSFFFGFRAVRFDVFFRFFFAISPPLIGSAPSARYAVPI